MEKYTQPKTVFYYIEFLGVSDERYIESENPNNSLGY